MLRGSPIMNFASRPFIVRMVIKKWTVASGNLSSKYFYFYSQTRKWAQTTRLKIVCNTGQQISPILNILQSYKSLKLNSNPNRCLFWMAALLLQISKVLLEKFKEIRRQGIRNPAKSYYLFYKVEFNSRGHSETANATKGMVFVIFCCKMINVDARKILVCNFGT
jgi:hypothetical protein